MHRVDHRTTINLASCFEEKLSSGMVGQALEAERTQAFSGTAWRHILEKVSASFQNGKTKELLISFRAGLELITDPLQQV